MRSSLRVSLNTPKLEDDHEDESVSSVEYEIKFPLPDHVDQSMCRDEFLKTFVKEEERRISLMTPRTSTRKSRAEMEEQLQWGGTKETPETMALIAVLLKWQLYHANVRKSMDARSSIASRRQSMMLDLNKQCQKAAIEFMSVRLLRQLRLFSSPWPGKLDDIPYHLFSWSLEHFKARLSLNQMYLDVLNRERTAEDLDCLKFRTDLDEIQTLIYNIRDDYRQDIDICDSSIKALHEAKFNLEGAWIKGVVENRKVREKLKAYILLDNSSSVCLKNIRLTALNDQFEDASALDPIELRYRINWLHSCADQRLMRLNGREEELVKQLKELELTIQQDNLVHHQTEHMYAIEVEGLRQKLNEWQSRFDNDLENIEVECTVSRLALQKVRDDYKFYMEQEVMYKRRIAEERELMAAEERMRRAKTERTSVDVTAAVKAIEAVYKPKDPKEQAKKKKQPAKF